MGIIMIVTTITLISFGMSKNILMQKIYVVLCAVVTIVGAFGSFAARSMMTQQLTTIPYSDVVNENFIAWVLDSYDKFAIISITLMVFGMIVVFLSLKIKNSSIPFIFEEPGRVVLCLQILIMLISVLYGIRTINKFFDLSGHIFILAICNAAVLCTGYIVDKKKKGGFRHD